MDQSNVSIQVTCQVLVTLATGKSCIIASAHHDLYFQYEFVYIVLCPHNGQCASIIT